MEQHPDIQVCFEFLKEWDIDYEEETLVDLVSWTKPQELEPTKESALDMNNWMWTGKKIIDAILKGNQSVEKVLTPWSHILKLL